LRSPAPPKPSHSRELFFPIAAQDVTRAAAVKNFIWVAAKRLSLAAHAGTRVAKNRPTIIQMKNSLHVLALVFAAGIPSAIAAGFAGVSLPAILGAGYLVLGFSLVLTLQLLLHDYAAIARPLVVPAEPVADVAVRAEKFPMRLAA
jgi:hypothetical protein